MSVDCSAAQKYIAKPELLHAALRLGNRIVDVEDRNHTGAYEFACINLAKLIEPIVIGAGYSGGELGVHGGYAEYIQSPAGIEHRKIDSLLIHSVELNSRTPAPFHMGPEEFLITVKDVARRRNCFRRRIHRSAPRSPIRSHESQIPDVIGGAPRRVIFELGIDESLPKVRRLQDVHVAVQHFESVFRHSSSVLQKLLCVWMGGDVFRCFIPVYS